MIQATTTLNKIAGLKKRIKVIQGGQGASKTFSILILLINHASSKPNKEILVLSAELTKMRLTVIKDFVKIMRMSGIYQESRFIAGTLYRFPNGSFIKFIGLDKSDVGKGLRSDIAYFNEVNKIDVETYRQVATRAKRVFADFNPDAEFFIHTDVIPRTDCDFLKVTFQDNEMLPQEERNEILLYKQLGYNEHGEIVNKYWANKWRVYGMGEVGSIDGVVFENWETATIPDQARLLYYGCDFGFATSKFAVVAVYNYNNTFYIKELVYQTNLTNQDAAALMIKNGYQKGMVVYCDYAEPKSIEELRRAGINAVPCDSKQDIKQFAIQKLNSQKFYIDEKSSNLVEELRYYIWDEKTGKPKKSEKDHLMDGLVYAVGSAGKYSGNYR
jgi:phage terminase large subunit